MPTFIETQFPIARLSAEAYKERKAITSQTLTCFSKWWGRKPLILVRASILGMLMPASSDPKRDREIFLKILTMDDDGAWHRQKGDIPVIAWLEAAPDDIREEFFTTRGWQRGLTDEEKESITARIWESLDAEGRKALDDQRRRPVPDREVYDAMPYAERITHCERPENVAGPTPEAWADINAHLGTSATSLPELIEQLGQRTFGHTPRVGDSFCGGGSIPFEAARIGCEAFGSDLNPVATLLTWASLNILGSGKKVQDEIRDIQKQVFASVASKVSEWNIESNENGERAEAYLYCVEVKPDASDYFIPLLPTQVVSEKNRIVIKWEYVAGSDRLQPEIISISSDEMKEWKGDSKKNIKPKKATVVESRVIDPFDHDRSWSIEALRSANGLRHWTNDDLVPRPGDVFQERLYCIRWVKTVTDDNGRTREVRRYAAPTEADLQREARVLDLLRERFPHWQAEGFIPSKPIPEKGAETDRLFRERGWTHWHHLFTPRQLLLHGLFAEACRNYSIVHSIRIGNMADFNSRLARYATSQDSINNTFSNQALNTLYTYPNRTMLTIGSAFFFRSSHPEIPKLSSSKVEQIDARDLRETCDIWVTDPPYADAVNYHELGDFFLAWYDKQLSNAFPEWTPDARAELAVRGDGEDFRRSMVEIYKNLARHMPDNGLQMVQFTHQDPGVWADLGMILWAAGLKATAAWTISTETEAVGIKKGNYVTGTVCLVLRKRVSPEPGFLDEVYPLVEDEVRRQIEFMQALDEDGEPNFNDADFNLAAYAAALKVLTQYATLDGKDVEHEVFAVRDRNTKSDFQIVIERAITIACDLLIPRGLDHSWRELSLVERYYLRALDIESRGERRKGMYEELARGFGVTDIRPLLKSDQANGTRMFTPSGFAASLLSAPGDAPSDSLALPRRGRAATATTHPFAPSQLRHLLFAIRETTAADNSPEPGRQYLRDTFGQSYWQRRERFIGLLEWLAALANAEGMSEWTADSHAARILAGRLRNDQA
jgi:adenine-specific DNA methylase